MSTIAITAAQYNTSLSAALSAAQALVLVTRAFKAVITFSPGAPTAQTSN